MLEAMHTCVTFYLLHSSERCILSVQANAANPSEEASLRNLTENKAHVCFAVVILNHLIPKATTTYNDWELKHYFHFFIPRCEGQRLP